MQRPTCTNIRIRSVYDAHKIFYAVQKGLLEMVTRRLDADERSQLRTGCVYAWEERGPHNEFSGLGIERFTEGRRWSPSRVRDEFLFYYEKYSPSPDSTNPHPPRDWDPLVKQTYSVWVETPKGRRKWHLTAYFTQATIDQLGTVDDIGDLRDLDVPEGIFKSTRINKTRTKTDDSRAGESSKSAGSSSRQTGATAPTNANESDGSSSGQILMYQPYPNHDASATQYHQQPLDDCAQSLPSRRVVPQIRPATRPISNPYPIVDPIPSAEDPASSAGLENNNTLRDVTQYLPRSQLWRPLRPHPDNRPPSFLHSDVNQSSEYDGTVLQSRPTTLPPPLTTNNNDGHAHAHGYVQSFSEPISISSSPLAMPSCSSSAPNLEALSNVPVRPIWPVEDNVTTGPSIMSRISSAPSIPALSRSHSHSNLEQLSTVSTSASPSSSSFYINDRAAGLSASVAVTMNPSSYPQPQQPPHSMQSNAPSISSFPIPPRNSHPGGPLPPIPYTPSSSAYNGLAASACTDLPSPSPSFRSIHTSHKPARFPNSTSTDVDNGPGSSFGFGAGLSASKGDEGSNIGVVCLAPLTSLARVHPYRREPMDDRTLRRLGPRPS